MVVDVSVRSLGFGLDLVSISPDLVLHRIFRNNRNTSLSDLKPLPISSRRFFHDLILILSLSNTATVSAALRN